MRQDGCAIFFDGHEIGRVGLTTLDFFQTFQFGTELPKALLLSFTFRMQPGDLCAGSGCAGSPVAVVDGLLPAVELR